MIVGLIGDLEGETPAAVECLRSLGERGVDGRLVPLSTQGSSVVTRT